MFPFAFESVFFGVRRVVRASTGSQQPHYAVRSHLQRDRRKQQDARYAASSSCSDMTRSLLLLLLLLFNIRHGSQSCPLSTRAFSHFYSRYRKGLFPVCTQSSGERTRRTMPRSRMHACGRWEAAESKSGGYTPSALTTGTRFRQHH